jgi:pimeloyl-ACP methyl ester carboxylesterase
MQQTQPDYSAHNLQSIRVPFAIVQSDHEEFIKREHAEYLAQAIPNAEFIVLNGVSHFAPVQRPEQFLTQSLDSYKNLPFWDPPAKCSPGRGARKNSRAAFGR